MPSSTKAQIADMPPEVAIKVRVARAQLGAALDLFVRDKDSCSVQALACGGCEVIEEIANLAGIEGFTTHIMKTFPLVDRRGVRRLQNQYWNAIKHVTSKDGKIREGDLELLSSFSDRANDAALFKGWRDYSLVAGKLPIAAQVFQMWWYATNEDRLAPGTDLGHIRSFFPKVAQEPRVEQKRRLRRKIEKYRDRSDLLSDPRTEEGPLLAPSVLS